MRTLPVLLALAACGTPDATKSDTDTDTGSVDTADSGDSGTATCDPVATASTSCQSASGTSLVGTLVSSDGTPLGRRGFLVQYCRDACLSPSCFDGNSWAFEDIDPGVGSFHIKPNCADERYADVYAPLTVEGGKVRLVDVVVPKLGAGVALPDTAAELEVTPGVRLTLSKGGLKAPPLEPTATEAAGVDATSSAAPIEGLGQGTVKAVFYLSPFDYTSSEGIPVRLDNTWSLAAGAGELWVGNYNAFLDEPDTDPWQKVGTLALDEDGKLVPESAPGVRAKLPRISTLVVFEPTP